MDFTAPAVLVPLLGFLEPWMGIHIAVSVVGVWWAALAVFFLLFGKLLGDESVANFCLRWFWPGPFLAFLGIYGLFAAVIFGTVKSAIAFWVPNK